MTGLDSTGWALQPLKKPAVPKHAGAQNPIDAFIGAALAKQDLTPAPSADRRVLIRRVTFDLIGLPPTPDEVDAFVNDPDPDAVAFAKVVDRLLASPHYGEQWARHWLDLVRYADSSGLANDFERPNAWRYRDYVIRSLNNDKPYDQFVREQIAGDELDPANPEFLIATGFLRMGPWEQTAMEVAKVSRQNFLDDVTDSIGQVFLSHPLSCAKCHDHKFDPIPAKDYYRFQAVFATTQLAEREAPFLPDENQMGFEEARYLRERIGRYEGILQQIAKKEETAARAWHAKRGLEFIPRNKALRLGLPEDRIAPRHIGLTPHDLGMKRIAEKNLARHRWELDRYKPLAYSVYSGATPELRHVSARLKMPENPETSGTVEETFILAGGDTFSPTEKVQPGVLSMVPYSASIPNSIHGRRLALAEWMVNPENPLTSRSMVNRIWQHHFGEALAGTPNNFGMLGKKPSHPALLDWLAAEFIESGWSIKALHRLILVSDAYQRSTAHPDRQRLMEKDPDLTSYAVYKPRRLSAEELRDSMLMVSGELSRTMGGIPARPEMHLEVALQPRQIMGTYAPAYQPSPRPHQRHRRSIYTLRLRGLSDPLMDVLNRPSSDLSCEMRDHSTVAPQALTLLNSQFVFNRATAMAARLRAETRSRQAAITQAFRLVYGRVPTRPEMEASLRHWERMLERQRNTVFKPLKQPTEVIREAVDENTGEVFEFTEQLEMAEDFVPDLQPSDVDPETRALADLCLALLNSNEFVYVY